MGRWREDEVDVAAKTWADQWVTNFGRAPDRSSRAVGPLGCTLGRVRELHDGASSSTTHDRHWPEVFLGQGLIVAVTLQAMAEMQRLVVWHHYVGRCYDTTSWARLIRPTKQVVVAHRLGLSLAEYYHRRDTAKSCIRLALTLDTKVLDLARGQMAQSAHVA